MSRRRHVCPGPACGRELQSWERLCVRCWRLLPADQRHAIMTARAQRNALALSGEVRAAVRWLAEHAPAVTTARILGEAPP